MKQVTIAIPDNCELKQDGNTYIITEKEKKLTYEDVVKELYPNSHQKLMAGYFNSEKHLQKLIATNKLMNVAKYLNSDWQPNWSSDEDKYYIYYSNQYGGLRIDVAVSVQENNIFFKSKELAEKAIEILGEDTIKLVLCTDY